MKNEWDKKLENELKEDGYSEITSKRLIDNMYRCNTEGSISEGLYTYEFYQYEYTYKKGSRVDNSTHIFEPKFGNNSYYIMKKGFFGQDYPKKNPNYIQSENTFWINKELKLYFLIFKNDIKNEKINVIDEIRNSLLIEDENNKIKK